jgi:hypothetical protein
MGRANRLGWARLCVQAVMRYMGPCTMILDVKYGDFQKYTKLTIELFFVIIVKLERHYLYKYISGSFHLLQVVFTVE